MTVTRTPKAGDRSAHDVVGFPEVHASDLEAGTPIHHVPEGGTEDDILTWDGGKWVAGAPPVPVDALDELTDVVITTPTDGQVLTYDNGTSMWVNEDATGGANALDDITDVVITTPIDQQVLTYDSFYGAWVNADPVAGTGAVDSVFGRTGDVVAIAGDYDASEIDFTPAGSLSSTDVQAAIEELDTTVSGISGGSGLTQGEIYALIG